MPRQYKLWLSSATALLLFLAMVVYTWPLKPGIPCLQLTFSETAFKDILAQWGAVGQLRFRAHFFIDFPVLVSYGVFGYLLATASPLFKKQSARHRIWLAWALPLAATLDVLENLLHLHLIAEPSTSLPALYLGAGIVASCKWLLIAVFALNTGVAWMKNRWMRSPPQAPTRSGEAPPIKGPPADPAIR